MRPKNPRQLDAIDRRLLQLLAENGRASNHALARAVSIAESTAHARVSALIEAGVIRGIHADIDASAVGRPIQALIQVQLHDDARPMMRELAATLARCSEVIDVFLLAGARDLLLRVAVADGAQLRDFVVSTLSRRHEIGSTETSMVLEHVHGAWGVS